MDIESAAASYLYAVKEIKAAERAKKDALEVLKAHLKPEDVVTVAGQLYRWDVTRGKSVKYKEALESVLEDADPQHQVMIEAAVAQATGKKTSYSLKKA